MSMFQETTIFLQIISQEKQIILIMATPGKIKELDDVIIDFNEYLETVSARLEYLDTGVKTIVEKSELKLKNYPRKLKKSSQT